MISVSCRKPIGELTSSGENTGLVARDQENHPTVSAFAALAHGERCNVRQADSNRRWYNEQRLVTPKPIQSPSRRT